MYEKYAELRDKMGLSDYSVAKKAGIGRSTLSDWKNGKHVPNVTNLQKIASVFGVPFDTFVEPMQENKIPIDKFQGHDITEFEYRIIQAFRNTSERVQDMILADLQLKRAASYDLKHA